MKVSTDWSEPMRVDLTAAGRLVLEQQRQIEYLRHRLRRVQEAARQLSGRCPLPDADAEGGE